MGWCYAFVHYFTNPSKILRLDVFFMLYPYNNTLNVTPKFDLSLCRLVQKAGVKYEKLVASGKPDWEARNLTAVDFVKAAKVIKYSNIYWGCFWSFILFLSNLLVNKI